MKTIDRCGQVFVQSRPGVRSRGSRVLLTAVFAILASAAAPVHAQAAQSATEARFRFEIPAQPLNAALRSFAEVTGLQLSYTAELVRDIVSSGVSGEMSASVALEQMLVGSGLSYRFVRPRVITLERAASGSGARMLGPVRVEGAESLAALNGINGSRDVTATEGTRSYTSGALTIGSKSPRSIKETPHSVSVITQQRMQDQNLTDFTKALNQAPGVTLVTGGSTGMSTNLQTTFYSRGFEINSIQIDGGAPLVTTFAGANRPSGFLPLIDMSQYDHVELLRGAAGFFNGYGDPSGSVNLVRKKPLDHSQVIWESQVGQWNHYRTMLDATSPLWLDGKLRGRVVLTYQDNDYFYERAEANRTMLYGVADYDLSPSTLFTVGVSVAREDTVPWSRGLPRYENGDDLNLPRNFSFVFPWNRWDVDTAELFGAVEQRYGDHWKAKLNLTRNVQEGSAKYGYAVGTINPQTKNGATLQASMRDHDSEQLAAELTLSGSFEVFGQRQELVVGLNHADANGAGGTTYETVIQGTPVNGPYQPYPGGPVFCRGSACPPGSVPELYPPIESPFTFDPYDRLYTEPRASLQANVLRQNRQIQSGAYLNVNLTAFDRWHLATGLRWSRYEYDFYQENLCAQVRPGCAIGDVISLSYSKYHDDDISWPPSVSISYDVTDSIRTYVGYADIYESQATQLTKAGTPIDPVTGTNLEAGIKWQPRAGRFNLALAAYRIEKEGYAQQDPSVPFYQPDLNHTCCYFQRSDRTLLSKGMDLEMTGEIMAGWQVSTGYTFNRNEQKGKYFETREGAPIVTRQPEHLLKLWMSYDFGASGTGAPSGLSRFTLSGGVNWQSDAYYAGRTCTEFRPRVDANGNSVVNWLGNPVIECAREVPYDFTQEPYAVWSARISYEASDAWTLALNLDNVTDTRYYQTVTDVSGGNWYGAPRNFMLTVRGKF